MKRTGECVYLVMEGGDVIHVTPSKLYAEKIVRLYKEKYGHEGVPYQFREMHTIVGETPEEQE